MQSLIKGWLKNLIKASKGGGLASWAVCLRLVRGQRYLIAGLVTVMLAFAGAPASAAAMSIESGSTPVSLPLPPDRWVALEKGEQHWYAFYDAGGAVDGGPITIRMTVLPEDGATFAVFTAEQIRRWLRGEELIAVGAGSKDEVFNHDFSWTGSFIQSGTYCILVKSSGRGLSNYKLTLSGKGLFFPRPTPGLANGPQLCTSGNNPPPVPQPTPTPGPTVVAPLSHSNPEQPLPPIGKAVTIAVGERQWYAFRDEGDEASIQVTADATPDHCLTFEVWTPDQLRLWQLGEQFRPVGEGTPNAFRKADLFWTGSFVKSGFYYVVVTRDPAVQGPCTYKLWVTGEDVSLVMP